MHRLPCPMEASALLQAGKPRYRQRTGGARLEPEAPPDNHSGTRCRLIIIERDEALSNQLDPVCHELLGMIARHFARNLRHLPSCGRHGVAYCAHRTQYLAWGGFSAVRIVSSIKMVNDPPAIIAAWMMGEPSVTQTARKRPTAAIIITRPSEVLKRLGVKTESGGVTI